MTARAASPPADIFRCAQELSGGVLARLFHRFGSDTIEGQLGRQVIRDALLRRTLQHAREHVPWYRNRPQRTQGAAPWDSLAQLPELTREDWASHHSQLIADDCKFAFASHTTGTTTGHFLQVFRSCQEQAFVSEFFLAASALRCDTASEIPLILTFPIAHHGVPMPLPIAGKLFVGGTADNHLLVDTRTLLETSFDIPGHQHRMSILSGPLYQILFFTSYLHETHYDFLGTSIRQLHTYGQVMSSHDREFLERSWNAPVIDRYSLTELLWGATSCSHCHAYHFDDFVIPELVDPVSRTPVSERVGSLLVTALYPFIQMQPVLRYDTGDIFERIGCPTSPARTAYRYIGRRQNCIFAVPESGAARLLLSSALCYGVLSGVPDVGRRPWFTNVTMVRDQTPGCGPLFRLESIQEKQRTNIHVHVELRYAPHLFAEHTVQLKAYLLQELLALHPDLQSLVDAGQASLDLTFYGPGSLKSPLPQKV